MQGWNVVYRNPRSAAISMVVVMGLLVTWPTAAVAGDPEIQVHAVGAIAVDIDPGADRGSITLPLQEATHCTTGQTMYFVISDVSELGFVEQFGGIRADSLAEAPDAAVEFIDFDGENWVFCNDAGTVAHVREDGTVQNVVANPDYSPLKRFQWNGKTVTANLPLVWWGDGPGQAMRIDQGGCDDAIRKNAPSPFFVGGGPFDGADCSVEDPIERYKGGQLLDVDLVNKTVTMKLHFAWYRFPDKLSHYTVFDASKPPPAGFMGTPHTPKVGANLGRLGDNDAVGRISQFSNGVRRLQGGPNRFQPGMTNYTGGQQAKYSPMWHITWVFFDCDGDGQFFTPERNVGEGAVPVAGSGIPGFDPADPETFDPFQMDDKAVECFDFVSEVTGSAFGFVEDGLGQLKKLIEDGHAIETEGPPGLRLDSTLQPPLIVNCPAPVTIRGLDAETIAAKQNLQQNLQ